MRVARLTGSLILSCLVLAACNLPGSTSVTVTPVTVTPLPVTSISPTPNQSHTYRLDPAALIALKARVQSGDPALLPVLTRLISDADKLLAPGPYSVMDKPQMPPSGDKHDFLSQSIYSWPDPSKANGLPYITRDGERNPEADKIPDETNLGRVIGNSEVLALAYFYTGNEAYAAHAALLLRTWFVEPATRMNPNMTYSQIVPGETKLRGGGIISAYRIDRVPDAVGLLAGSGAWTVADQTGLQEWFRSYLTWLQNSAQGKEEAAATNNHGTWYDTQVIAAALFIGQNDVARQAAQQSQTKRIAAQVEPDGSQPLELNRTRSWSYSVYNLEAFFDLAALAQRAGVDLWRYQSSDGRSIRAALDYLIPYALDPGTWKRKQITPWSGDELAPFLYQAATVYQDSQYLSDFRQVAGANATTDRNALLFAPLPH